MNWTDDDQPGGLLKLAIGVAFAVLGAFLLKMLSEVTP